MSVAMQLLETGTRQADSRQEAARLAALAAYNVLDTPPERCYDDLTRLAAEYFQADAACLGFADESPHLPFDSPYPSLRALRSIEIDCSLSGLLVCQPPGRTHRPKTANRRSLG